MNNKAHDKIRLKVIRTIETHGLLQGAKNVLLGFSGGMDSSVLFDILLSLREKYGFTLYASHINHSLRGEESDSDEEFVKKRCEEFGVKLFITRVNIPELASQSGKSIELAARETRYAAFAETAKQKGIQRIATAHHADDNAETMIFNLTRGAGLEGLSGIPYQRKAIVRPLLDVTREEIQRYAQVHGIPFVSDATNADESFARNKIRRRVIPVLKEINPAFVETAAAKSSFFSLAARRLSDEAARLKGDLSGEDEVLVLQYIFQNCPVYCGAENALRILKALTAKKRRVFSLSGGMFAYCENGVLHFGPYKKPKNEKLEYTRLCSGKTILAGGKVVIYRNPDGKNFNDINKFSTTITLYSAIINEAIFAKTRTEGDVLRINGMTKTLKKELINKKVPAVYRGLIPVVVTEKETVCVPFVGVSDKFQAKDALLRETFVFCFDFKLS